MNRKWEVAVVVLVFVGALVLGVLLGCDGLPQSRPAETTDGTYHGIVWSEINPPRPGPRCWATIWDDGGYGGFAISHCEEAP